MFSNTYVVNAISDASPVAGNETARTHGACQDGECTRFWLRITRHRRPPGAHGSGCRAPRNQGWPFLLTAPYGHTWFTSQLTMLLVRIASARNWFSVSSP